MEKDQSLKLIEDIRKRNIQAPFKLNACTTVHDLKKYLRVLESSIIKTEKPKILRVLLDKVEELNSEMCNIVK